MIGFKEQVVGTALGRSESAPYTCTYVRQGDPRIASAILLEYTLAASLCQKGRLISMGPPSVSCLVGLLGLEHKGSQAWEQKNKR